MDGVTEIGALDRRITFLRFTSAPNGFNEQIQTWADLKTVWANVVDASASESYRAQEVGASISVRFTVRWSSISSGINPKDRIRYADREYDITAVRNVGRNVWREIDAVARAD